MKSRIPTSHPRGSATGWSGFLPRTAVVRVDSGVLTRFVKRTCTRLVTQTWEQLGDVVGDGGFGVELLTAELDGDLLQWA